MQNTAELRSLLLDDTYSFRFNCGYTKPVHCMDVDDKDDFIRSIWLHYVLFRPYAELEQLKKGFQETLQMQVLVCTYGKEVRLCLAASQLFNVTPNCLQDAFMIDYSDNGSNNRTKEEAIVYFWFEYISNCKGK